MWNTTSVTTERDECIGYSLSALPWNILCVALQRDTECLYDCRHRWLQIRSLREQLEGVQPGRQELVTKYEQQLQRVREEVRPFSVKNDCQQAQ